MDNRSLRFLTEKLKLVHHTLLHLHFKGKITVTTTATSQTHLGHVCLAADLPAARIRRDVFWLFFGGHRALSCPVDLQTKKPS